MGRKIRDTLIFLAAVAGCFLLTLALSGGDIFSPAMTYNYVFLGIMVILYLTALIGGMFRMSNASAWLNESAYQIDEMESQEPIEDKIQEIDTFPPFSDALDGFLQDIRRSQSGICDIEDYLNEDETDCKW